jgi:5-methylcytosine-specific restriction endonuclease McrA
MGRRPYINQEMRREVAERYGCGDGERVEIACAYCGDPITIDRTNPKRVRFLDSGGTCRPELDHVESLFLGGPHVASNLVPACLRCNRSKGGAKAKPKHWDKASFSNA